MKFPPPHYAGLARFLWWSLGLCFAGLAMGVTTQGTEQQIKHLKADISRLETQLSRARGERKSQQNSLRTSELESGQTEIELRQIEQSLNASRQRLTGLAQETLDLEQLRDTQARRLAKQLAGAYRAGQQDRLKLLLSQERPEQVGRVLHYYEYLNRARTEAMDSYRHTLDSLVEVKAGFFAQEQTLTAQQQKLKQRSNQLRLSRLQREKILKQITADISKRGDRLKTLKSDQQRLERVLTEIQQSLSVNDLAFDSREFAQLKGQLRWPTTGKVARGYGSLIGANGPKMEGLFLSAGRGATVKAVHHGRVVFADWLRGYGLLLILDHGGGYMSLYGHNQSLLKEAGDWVSANDQVATVGDSGGQQQSGLYFAIRHKGAPRNPASWLSKKRD
jgi:septal ring factor EnvC (AmiA/AmiB activator)